MGILPNSSVGDRPLFSDPETVRRLCDEMAASAMRSAACSRDEAEEMSQQSILRFLIWRGRQPAEREVSDRASLFAVLKYVVMEARRARRRSPVCLDVLTTIPCRVNEDDAADWSRLEPLIHSLPNRQREVVNFTRAGLSDSRIGEILGIACVTVRVIRHRAVKRIRTAALQPD